MQKLLFCDGILLIVYCETDNFVTSMPEYCPYCNSVQSVLMGNVYCSNHGPAMHDLDSGTLFIKSSKLEETAEHISRLSIRCMLNAPQHYKVDGNDHLVTPDNFLVVNQGQRYQTSFKGSGDCEMLLVAFNPSFVRQVFYAQTNTDMALLDNPFEDLASPVYLFDKTYDKDPFIAGIFRKLRLLIDEPDEGYKKETDLHYYYALLLERLLKVHHNTMHEVKKVKAVKASTQKEIYRRVSIAKDFLDMHFATTYNLDALSAVACMSPHHFLRSFKHITGYTPHTYIVHKRIAMAQQLLRCNDMPVQDICQSVGFENASSFARLFKERTHLTPQQYRQLNC